jgi:hypothetical protein
LSPYVYYIKLLFYLYFYQLFSFFKNTNFFNYTENYQFGSKGQKAKSKGQRAEGKAAGLSLRCCCQSGLWFVVYLVTGYRLQVAGYRLQVVKVVGLSGCLTIWLSGSRFQF